MINKCPCQFCNINIEFDTEDFKPGNTVNCPKCGLETTLFLPAPRVTPVLPVLQHPSAPKTPVETVEVPKSSPTISPPSTSGLDVATVLLSVVGFGLVFSGCSAELSEQSRETGSAIRQTVYALQYGSGLIVITLCFILRALCRLIKQS